MDEQRVGGREMEMQPRHTVAGRLELDSAFGAGTRVPLGEGLGEHVFPQPPRDPSQPGRGRRLGARGELAIEAASRLVVELGGLVDDHTDVRLVDVAGPQGGERRGKHVRQRPGVGDPSLHRALGDPQRSGELGHDGSARELATLCRRDPGRGERDRAAFRVVDGQVDHVDAHRRVHRLDAPRMHRRVDQLAETLLCDRIRRSLGAACRRR